MCVWAYMLYIDMDIDSVILELGAAEFGAQQVQIYIHIL